MLPLVALVTLPSLPPPLDTLTTTTETSATTTLLPEVTITLPEVTVPTTLPTIIVTLPTVPLVTLPTVIVIPTRAETPPSAPDETPASSLSTVSAAAEPWGPPEPIHPVLLVAVGGSLGAALALVALGLLGRKRL